MDELNKRVVSLLATTAKNKGDIAQLLEISPAQLSHIYSGRNKPGIDLLQKLLHHIPKTNAAWLLSGIGEMLITDDNNQLETLQLTLKKTLHRLKEVELITKEMEIEIKQLLASTNETMRDQ